MNNPIPFGPQTARKTNWLKIIGLAILVFVLGIVGIIALVFQLGSAPMKAGSDFLTLLASGKTAEAYQSASIQFKQAVPEDDFQYFLESYPILTRVKTPSFNSFSVENNTFATISGTLTGTDGQVSPISIQLVNENEAWRVLNVDLNPPAREKDSVSLDLESDPDF
jgi:hypothetical protein